jgi:hypothetical protein
MEGGENDSVGCYMSVSQTWSAVNPVILVQLLLTDVDDDNLQGFPNKQISKSKILDMVCTVRNFENINKETQKNACRMMGVKWASST